MAVETTESIIQYEGNGSTLVGYPFPYLFFDTGHIVVIVTDPAGVDTRLEPMEDYTVTGAGNPEGGEVFTNTAWSEHYRITILREVPAVQPEVYQEHGRFPAKSHERGLDRVVMMVQQLMRQMARTLRVSETSPDFIDLDGRGGKILGFDDWGNVRLLTPEEIVGSMIGTVATKADLAAAVEDMLLRAAAGRSYVPLLMAGTVYTGLESGFFEADFDTQLKGVFLSAQTPGNEVSIILVDGEDNELLTVTLPANERHLAVWLEDVIWIQNETTIRAKVLAAPDPIAGNPQFLSVSLILQKPAPNEEDVGQPPEPDPEPPEPVANIPSGTIWDFAGGVAPEGWLECDGQAVSRETYAALFAVIGATWGHGDGASTFNVPNLQRRVTVGRGGVTSAQLGNAIGNLGGVEQVNLTVAQLPAHSHQQGARVLTENSSNGYGLASGGLWARRILDRRVASQNTGGGQAHPNMQPSAVVMKIIKT